MNAEEVVVSTQHPETYNGHPLTVIVCRTEAGTWQAKAELDLGHSGHVIFENDGVAYDTEEQARAGAMAQVAERLACSRIGKSK